MRTITLASGESSRVDSQDYDRINSYKWRNVHGYAMTGSKTRSMHRTILGAPVGMTVDHINGDRLDNRRINLRLCTQIQNQGNKRIPSNNSSGYKGVTKFNNKWRAMIGVRGNMAHIGLYNTKEDAALAYDCAAIQIFGEYARCNIL